MKDEILSFEEWVRHPSWHCSYDDYVRHMKGMIRWIEKDKEEALIEKIANRVVEKLKERKE